jgi:hypothetical protein
LPKKLQSFWIYKLETKNLKKNNFNITLNLDDARLNGQVVSLGDNQVLRSLRQLKNKPFDENVLNKLLLEKKKIKNKQNQKQNRDRLKNLENRINDLLFVPELVSVVISDNRHYEKIIQQGLFINGHKYTRLLCGAGNARRSTTFLIEESYEKDLKRLLNNNRDETVKLVPSKFNAYFGLYNSATLPVPEPRVCVIPDCEIKRLTKVDYMVESERYGYDDQIEEREVECEFSLFDGQGLISPNQSRLWSESLELDWLPSAWIVRTSFTKGLLVTFDFLDFAIQYKKDTIIDVWGKSHKVDEIDVLLSVSQFKLWSCYPSYECFADSCRQNGIGWGVSRYAPKINKNFSYSTYQYLQTLNITEDAQIESLCKDTVDWFHDITGGDIYKSILYLMGESVGYEYEEGWFDKISDPIVKSLLLEPELIKDPFIRQHIINSINKKIKESYMGVLLINGANYQMMIADPFAQVQHAFGLPVTGLLKEKQHYSQYWNNKGVEKVAALRAPMTWRSETSILDLQCTEEMNKYYKHLYSGVVFNVHGDDCMRMSGCDFDGDICLTTDKKEFVDLSYGGNPIIYERKSAKKEIIQEDSLWLHDLKAMGSRIGFITNISTTLYSSLPLYGVDSVEHQTILNRIKLCCCAQSMEIDHAKGIETKPFSKWWTNWTKLKEEMPEEEKKQATFNNSIVCDKRPLFFRWLYPNYNHDYIKHRNNYENYSWSKFDFGIDELLAKEEKTEYQQVIVKNYNRYNPLLEINSIMQKTSFYMQSKVKQIKQCNKSQRYDYTFLFGATGLSEEELYRLKKLHEKFRFHKQKIAENDCDTVEQYLSLLRKEILTISNNIKDLVIASLVLDSKFAFQVLGNDLVTLLTRVKKGKVNTLVVDDQGEITYLGKRYAIKNEKINY